MLKKTILAGFFVAGAMFMGNVQAATQGEVGRTSTGSFEVMLKINPYVQIKDMKDVALTESTPEVTQTFTILSNQESYRMEVDHDELTNGQNTIPYEVSIHKDGTEITDLLNVPHDMERENVPNNMSVKVSVDPITIKNTKQGDYRDTVTITVAVK